MKVLITGISGQDGSILAKKLLAKGGYEIHGIIRRSAGGQAGRWRLDGFMDKIQFHYGDLTDHQSVMEIVRNVRPDWVFNLGAQSQVGISYANPMYTMEATGVGACNLMECVFNVNPQARFYQASSSEMWGETGITMMGSMDEAYPLNPISPYAVAKVMAHNYALMKRRQGFHAVIGILNNHESEWRGDNFVTTKVVKKAAARQKVTLGYLGAVRDWGYAPEYVKGMIMMMEHDTPETFVLGTGKGHTVEEFVREAYAYVGLDWKKMVEHSDRFRRPVEAGPLIGDYNKAYRTLGWEPKIAFKDLIAIMMDHEIRNQKEG